MCRDPPLAYSSSRYLSAPTCHPNVHHVHGGMGSDQYFWFDSNVQRTKLSVVLCDVSHLDGDLLVRGYDQFVHL